MIDRLLASYLEQVFDKYPVLTVTGPRQSGKTTLCRAVFPNKPYVNLEALDQRQYATEDPRGFLAQFPDGAILDEFQRTPDLPSYLQGVVDDDGRSGLFVLTGSQNLQLANTVNQSLAGRTAVVTLLPLSVPEIGGAAGKQAVNDLIFSGGYPRIYQAGLSPTQALSDYVATYVERDIRELSNITSMPEYRRFMQLCAGRVAQLVNYNNLGNEAGVSGPTIKKWFSLLEATYVTFTLQPFAGNISKRVVKSPKLYFYDVGLACYLLGIESPDQLNAHPLRGALFENLVVVECLKWRLNAGRRSNLYFYRDSAGNEVDIVLEQALSPTLIEAKASATLSKSFSKGFDSFVDASGETKATRILVYQGESARSAYGMHVTDIWEFSELLSNVG